MLDEEQYKTLCEAIIRSHRKELKLSICDLKDEEEIGYLMKLARKLNSDLKVKTQWILFTCSNCEHTKAILEIKK